MIHINKKHSMLIGMTILTFGALNSSGNAYATSYAGGVGTKSHPYLISTPEQLDFLRQQVAAGATGEGDYFRLANDIDLSGFDTDADPSNGNWSPIGDDGTKPFKGNFDGNNYAIRNMVIETPDEDYVGLFGNVVSVEISNLAIENAKVVGNGNVGGLTGYIGGDVSNSSISQVKVSGSVKGAGDNVGGLVGYNDFGGKIENCYSLADVIGRYNVGGLVGGNAGAGGSLSEGTISTSYAAGRVTSAVGNKGSAVGQNNGTVTNVFFDESKANSSDGGAGTPLPTDLMTKAKAEKNLTGFDFSSVWRVTNTYPMFQWEGGAALTEKESAINIEGDVKPLIASITIPTTNLEFVVDPNQEEGKQFITSEFSLINETKAPITLKIGSFKQTTSVFNDVLPSAHSDWSNLNKEESKDFALGLVPKSGSGWKSLTEGVRYPADTSNYDLGVVNANATVEFEFEAKYGTLFTEKIKPRYELVFLFDFE